MLQHARAHVDVLRRCLPSHRSRVSAIETAWLPTVSGLWPAQLKVLFADTAKLMAYTYISLHVGLRRSLCQHHVTDYIFIAMSSLAKSAVEIPVDARWSAVGGVCLITERSRSAHKRSMQLAACAAAGSKQTVSAVLVEMLSKP